MADPAFTIAAGGEAIPSEAPKLAAYRLMAWANRAGLGYTLTVDGDRYTVTIDGCESTTYRRIGQ